MNIFFHWHRKRIRAFLDNLQSPLFTQDYLNTHCQEINALEWLLAYYEGRAGCSPRELLDSILDSSCNKEWWAWARVLFAWMDKKQIVGF